MFKLHKISELYNNVYLRSFTSNSHFYNNIMPDAMIEKMEKLAAQHDISFNQLVIQCCEYAMEHLNKPESQKKDT